MAIDEADPAAQDDGAPLLPALPIVDPHHHLWDGVAALGPYAGRRYDGPRFVEDMMAGHNVVQTIAVECRSHYRTEGPPELRPVGETNHFLAAGRAGPTGMCAAIVGHADLRLGDRVAAVLEAHVEAGAGRFRGIRQSAAWDDDPCFEGRSSGPRGLLADRSFREGFARLAPLGLSFDAWLYHPQLRELADLAGAFPATTIVLDHCGGLLGVGRHGTDRAATFARWRADLARVARHPNVWLKIGGLGMWLGGSPLCGRVPPASRAEMAEDYRPVVEACIDIFGPARCMFESNFPVDSATGSYARLWNVFKMLAMDLGADERAALFSGSARRAYRL